MTWTGLALNQFARGVTPSSRGNIRLMDGGLPGIPKPWAGTDDRLSLDDYHPTELARRLVDLRHFVSDHDVSRVLSPDYWDDAGDYRKMQQLGGALGPHSVHFTYESATPGEPVHRYSMVLGADAPYRAEAIAWRNMAGVVMASAGEHWSERFITAANFFVGSQAYLQKRFPQDGLGGPAIVNLAMNIFLAQNGGRRSDVQVQERPSSDPYVSGAIVASSKWYPQLGHVDVIPLAILGQPPHYLVVINNVLKHKDWDRHYANVGLQVTHGAVNAAFEARAGAGDHNAVTQELDRLRASGRNLHEELYTRANRALWQATGVGV